MLIATLLTLTLTLSASANDFIATVETVNEVESTTQEFQPALPQAAESDADTFKSNIVKVSDQKKFLSGKGTCEDLAVKDALNLEKEKPSWCRDPAPVVTRKSMKGINYVKVSARGGSSYDCGQIDEYFYAIEQETKQSCTLSWYE